MWQRALDLVFPPQCAHCNALGSGLCRICFPVAPLVRMQLVGLTVDAAGWYEDGLRSAVLACKDGRRDVAQSLGERIAPLIPSGSLLIPVPTSARRRRTRGVDGVALIARTAAELADACVLEALTLSAADAQRGRSRAQRLAARERFACNALDVKGKAVILVDDVCTTGATLRDCVEALAKAGATAKRAVVAAVTKTNVRGRTFPTTRI